jgi:tripartite-type tricarboxylate transporter receptor subunit TctC
VPRLALVLLTAALAWQPAAAQPHSTGSGQAFPARTVRLLVSIPPGGGPDIVARLLAPRLSESLGQPVVVENRVGGNGTVAGEVLVKSAPDGHTLFVAADSVLVINPHLYGRMPFDPLKDFVPVASLVSNGFFLAVNPSVPARTFPEFIEYVRNANPPLQYGSGGNGSQHHLTMERLKQRAGFAMVHVPYKGGAPATTATVAGVVPAMMSGTSTAGQIKAGRLRALAFTGQ